MQEFARFELPKLTVEDLRLMTMSMRRMQPDDQADGDAVSLLDRFSWIRSLSPLPSRNFLFPIRVSFPVLGKSFSCWNSIPSQNGTEDSTRLLLLHSRAAAAASASSVDGERTEQIRTGRSNVLCLLYFNPINLYKSLQSVTKDHRHHPPHASSLDVSEWRNDRRRLQWGEHSIQQTRSPSWYLVRSCIWDQFRIWIYSGWNEINEYSMEEEKNLISFVPQT